MTPNGLGGGVYVLSMIPPQRPRSTHSWWSDRNPPGATIPLHALSKPVSKFMHHRQVLRLISKCRLSPLSRDKLDLLTIYLGSKEIGVATKVVILRELIIRAESEAEARVMANEIALLVLIGLLHSSDPQVLASTCQIIGKLVQHKSVKAAVIGMVPCVLLGSLLHHTEVSVQRHAAFALSHISGPSAGASAVIKTDAPRRAIELLESPDFGVLESVCRMLGNLAWHRSLNKTILSLDPCPRLVALLSHSDSSVQQHAVYALQRIGLWSLTGDSHRPEAHALGRAIEVLDLGEDFVLGSTCHMLGSPAIVELAPCERLVLLLHHPEIWVQKQAIYVLCHISAWSLAGASSVATANFLDFATTLLNSTDPFILESTCRLLGNLAQHESINTVVVECAPVLRLVSLLMHSDRWVRKQAVYALSHISSLDTGMSLLADANPLRDVSELLESNDADLLASASKVSISLAGRESVNTSRIELADNLSDFEETQLIRHASCRYTHTDFVNRNV